MFGNVNFKRFDSSSTSSGFAYQKTDNTKDVENNPYVTSLDNLGFNQSVSVKNYMAEAVMLGANVRSTPQRINSLLRDHMRPRHDQQNFVVVTIYTSENVTTPSARSKPTQVKKTEIKIPGNMLNQGSVFIDELDCYITTESNLEATRELIARDAYHQQNQQDAINVPASFVQQDPITLYFQYKELIDSCIRRQNKINIRVGFDIRYGIVPDVIKNMHVAVLDHYFVPFNYHKLVFDPTLDEDEFVIENLHLVSRQELRFRFSELSRLGVVYLDHELHDTMFGKFYGVALFANEAFYTDYVYQRKATERFNDETLFVAERSGDPRLKEEIINLQRDKSLLTTSVAEKDSEVIELKSRLTRLNQELKDRETTINRIRTNHDAHQNVDVVMQELENNRNKIFVEAKKVDNDSKDQEYRQKSLHLSHKAAMLKTVGDILKSGWGITTACIGGILSVVVVLKKYNVKLTMG